MDQSTQPQSYSDSDFVQNPNYQPAQASSYQDSDFVANPNYKDTGSSELQVNPEDNLAMKGLKTVGGVAEGIGEGVFGTLAGATDIAGAKGTGVSKELHKLAGDNVQQHGTAQNIGQGFESIAEFIMGDEALKGLSLGDKLIQTSKVMKTLEKMPKLATALRLGINVGKAGAELTPEERALVQKSPVLARLVGAGMDAIRQGGVQTVQEAIKHPDEKANDALKSGAAMAGTSAALGGAFGTVGGLVSKGAEGAENAGALRDLAQGAPTGAEANDQFAQSATNAIQPKIDAAQGTKDAVEQLVNESGDDVGSIAANAPEHSSIVASTLQAAKNAYKALGDEFEKGRGFLKNAAGDNTLAYEGSPLQKAAATLSEQGEGEAKPLDAAFSQTRPGSPQANKMLDGLIDPYGEKELKEQVGNAVKDEQGNLPKAAQSAQDELDEIAKTKTDKPIQLNMEELLDRRKQLNERLRNTGWANSSDLADRDVYHTLIQGVDDSIQSLLEQNGKPEDITKLQQMNEAYKTGIARFKNPDVRAILNGNVNDVAKKLMSGATSVDDINTVRKTIGDEAFQKLSDSSLRRLVADSVDPKTQEFGFKSFLTKWNKISPNVRDAMFGGAVDRDVIDRAVKLSANVNKSGIVPQADANIAETTKMLKGILGNGTIDSLIQDPTRVQQLASVIGPDSMSELGKTVLQNQLREAATKISSTGESEVGNVDTTKFLRFVSSLKDSPEVVDALFKPTKESAEGYHKLLMQVHNVEGVKSAIRMGILAPSLGAAAGGGVFHVPLALVLGAMAGEGAGAFPAAKHLLDKIANSPAAWSALKGAGKIAESPLTKGATIVSKAAAGKAVADTRAKLRQGLEGSQSVLQ